ncbi:MAG: NrsF family protein [Polyangiales bacterium]
MNDPLNSDPPWDPDFFANIQSTESERDPQCPVDALYHSTIEQCRADKQSWVARFRDAATPKRALGVAVFFAMLLSVFFATAPDSVKNAMTARWWFTAFGYVALIFVSTAWLLRPVYRPEISVRRIGWLAACSMVAVIAFAFYTAHSNALESFNPQSTIACFGFGIAMAVPIFAVLRLVDRGTPLGNVLGAVASGVAAILLLQLHCPLASRDHLLFGHGSVLAAFLVVVLGLRWLRIRKKGV